MKETGVCIEGRIPDYTPVSAYNGHTLQDNTAGIFVGCINSGSSGFKVGLSNVFITFWHAINGGETQHRVMHGFIKFHEIMNTNPPYNGN